MKKGQLLCSLLSYCGAEKVSQIPTVPELQGFWGVSRISCRTRFCLFHERMHHPGCELPWCPASSDQLYNAGEDRTDSNGQLKPAGGSAGQPAQGKTARRRDRCHLEKRGPWWTLQNKRLPGLRAISLLKTCDRR